MNWHLSDKKRWLVAALTLLPFSAWGLTLTKIDAFSLPEEAVELKLHFDEMAPVPYAYSVENPPRIALDLPYTSSTLETYQSIALNNVESVTVIEGKDRTRLVINLEDSVAFSTQMHDNSLSVFIGDNPALHSQNVQNADVETPVSPGINEIDFSVGELGEGEVMIRFGTAHTPMDISKEHNRIVIQFAEDILPKALHNRLDVMDFGTHVKYIDAQVVDGRTFISIEPKENFEYTAYQMEKELIVSVKEVAEVASGYHQEGVLYVGDRMSLNFQNIEVRTVLQLIADFAKLNLVASDTVSGNVTLRLDDVPWDQALDIVLKTKGLDKRVANNVLTVAPANEIATREREQLENDKQMRELAPVYTEVIQINYADAAEIGEILLGGEENTLLTEQGSVQVVDRTNSLLIKDTRAKVSEIRALIEQLDIPVKQVMIEARIVTIDSDAKQQLGIEWNAAFDSKGGTGTDGIDADLSFDSDGNTGITLGLGNGSGELLDLTLNAVLSDGGGEIISQPKLVTADKTTATIRSGQEIPYQESTSSGATATAFKDALLGLEVTPQITPDGRVIMQLKVNNDEPDTDTTPPSIRTNEIITQVLVENGQTVVLGGVYKQSERSAVSKVPFLGDLPGIGKLFRNTLETATRNELLIFITPTILVEGQPLH